MAAKELFDMSNRTRRSRLCHPWRKLGFVLIIFAVLAGDSRQGRSADAYRGKNISAQGFDWVTVVDGDDLEGEVDSNDGAGSLVEERTDADGDGFPTLDSMLQWAIGHSDPEKLKGVAQEMERLTPKELEKRRGDIKELMDRLKMPSDGDLMKIAIADLQNSSLSVEEHQRALQELLVLVEPIDNANDLNKLGGLVALINELERDEEELRTTAAWILGKASQNNPFVQDQILRLGVLPHLIKMVRSNNSEEAVKALYAVSALVRNFPFAQEEFYLQGGSALLQEIMSNKSIDIRLTRKSLFLLADLAEQQLQTGTQSSHASDKRLLKPVVDLMGSSDLDTQEKALVAVHSLVRLKGPTLKMLRELCELETVLGRLETQLQQLMENEAHAELASDMELLRQEILRTLVSNSNDTLKQ